MYRQWSPYVLPVVTICTASGHCVYCQLSLYVPPVVTICTASGHCMYCQWSLYVPPVVTVCTARGHYMYRQRSLYKPPVVTLCTTSLTFSNSAFYPHSIFMCFLWIWEQTAIISLYSINWLICMTKTECVYCAVRTGYSREINLYIPLRPARPRTQHDCHHDTKVKPEAATAVIELLMMGGKTPETCWVVNKRQDNKPENFCIWLVSYLNCTVIMHGLTDLK
jgi:hypothetical protein